MPTLDYHPIYDPYIPDNEFGYNRKEIIGKFIGKRSSKGLEKRGVDSLSDRIKSLQKKTSISCEYEERFRPHRSIVYKIDKRPSHDEFLSRIKKLVHNDENPFRLL